MLIVLTSRDLVCTDCILAKEEEQAILKRKVIFGLHWNLFYYVIDGRRCCT